MRLYITIFAAFLLALLGVIWGAWFAPFVVGIGFGAAERRARVAVPASAGVGMLSWLAPLAVGQVRFGLGATAQSLAAIMGFGHDSAVPLILTLLVGALLGLTGAWLASAVVSTYREVSAQRS